MAPESGWPPPADEIARVFDERASSYDQSAMHGWVAVRTVAEVEQLPRGAVLLDAAAGTGLASAALLERAPDARVVAVDLSRGLLRVARARPGVAPVHADAARLPLVGGCIDAAVCVSAAAYFPDPQRVLREIARVLRPGSQLVLQVWAADGLLVARALRTAAAGIGVALVDPNVALGSAEQLVGDLQVAGFQKTRITSDVWHEEWPDPAAAWTALLEGVSGGPLRAAPQPALADARMRFLEDLARAKRRHNRDRQHLLIASART